MSLLDKGGVNIPLHEFLQSKSRENDESKYINDSNLIHAMDWVLELGYITEDQRNSAIEKLYHNDRMLKDALVTLTNHTKGKSK